jgi:hypothetical protein
MVQGRIIGVSQVTLGIPAMRMSLQTREQHIRRDNLVASVKVSRSLNPLSSAIRLPNKIPSGTVFETISSIEFCPVACNIAVISAALRPMCLSKNSSLIMNIKTLNKKAFYHIKH